VRPTLPAIAELQVHGTVPFPSAALIEDPQQSGHGRQGVHEPSDVSPPKLTQSGKPADLRPVITADKSMGVVQESADE